ncbi:MAG: hypothetical protein ACLFNM_00160 [Candidatus Woesearchaeota archaeon]
MKKELLSSKKAIIIGVPVGVFLLFITFLVMSSNATNVQVDNPIGEIQYDMLYKSELATYADLYIDMGATFAAQKAQEDFFEQGGIFLQNTVSGSKQKPPCGSLLYNTYATPTKNCVPDFEESFQMYLSAAVREFVGQFQPVSLQFVYDYEFKEEKNHTTIFATIDQEPKIPLKQRTVQAQNSVPRIQDALLRLQLLDVDSIQEETIITCSTGKCFAQVGQSLYERHVRDQHIEYVPGGESPYTFSQIIKDQTKNEEKSFFHDVVAEQFVSQTRIPSTPGFDSAGWIWWVAKHANVSLLNQRDSPSQYYVAATKEETTLVCGTYFDDFIASKKSSLQNEDIPSCSLTHIFDRAQPGDILFIQDSTDTFKRSTPISEVALYIGDGQIIQSTPSQGLVQRTIPNYYATSDFTDVLAVIRYSYNQSGVTNIEENANQQDTDIGGFVYFTPSLSTSTSLLFSHFNPLDEFVQTLQTSCTQPTKDCVKKITAQFNKKHKLKTKITLDKEENALVYDFLDQLLACQQLKTTSCVCTFDIDYSLPTSEDKVALVLFESGQAFVTKVVDAQPQTDSMQYITQLPFSPTKLYLSDSAESQVYFIFDKENKKTTLYAGQQKWVFDKDFATEQSSDSLQFMTNSFLPSFVDVKNVKPSLYKAYTQDDLKDVSHATGPVFSCSGTEELSTTYQKQLYEIAWNSDGKTYLEIALEAAKEFDADPALLLTHAIHESSMGLQNSCVLSTQQSSLTGCGWQSSICEQGPTPSLQEYVRSDLDQFRCTAQVDSGAVKEVLTKTPQPLSAGNYVKCAPYQNDPQTYWNCIFCSYQGSYDHALVAQGDDPTRKPYFTKDKTCEYAQKLTQTYCELVTFLEDIDELSIQDTSCSNIVEYAKEYVGTGFGQTTRCSAQDASAGTCTTQDATFVESVYYFAKDDNNNSLQKEILGTGLDKCNQQSTRDNQFINPALLRPGDLFSATKKTALGHTGIYVGKGIISKPSPKNSRCKLEFEPDPEGEPIFIHSIDPVCYNTLEEIERTYTIQTFCRVDMCGDVTAKSESRTNEKATRLYPLHWIPFNTSYGEFSCSLAQTAYRFQAEFPFTQKKLRFGVELASQIDYEPTVPKIQQQACATDSTPLLISWNITQDENKPFAFVLDLYSSEEKYQTYKKSMLDDSANEDSLASIPSSLAHRRIPLQGAKERENFADPYDQKNTLFKKIQDDGSIIYTYLWAPQDSMVEDINYTHTYSVVSSEIDIYDNLHYPQKSQQIQFKSFTASTPYGPQKTFAQPAQSCAAERFVYVGSYLRTVQQQYTDLISSFSPTIEQVAQGDSSTQLSQTKAFSYLKEDLDDLANAFSQEDGLLAVSLTTTNDDMLFVSEPFISVNSKKVVDTMSAFKIKLASLAYALTPANQWPELDTHVQPMLEVSDNKQTTLVLEHIESMLSQNDFSLPAFSALDSFLENNNLQDSTYTAWQSVSSSSISPAKAYKNHRSSLTSTADDFTLFYSQLYNKKLTLPSSMASKVKQSLGLSQQAYDAHVKQAQQKTIDMLSMYNDLEYPFFTDMPSSGFTQDTAIGKTGLMSASESYPHNIATQAGLVTACDGKTYSYAVFAVEGETIASTMQMRHDATVLLDSFLQNDLCGGEYETVTGINAIEFPEFERITCEEAYFTNDPNKKRRICAAIPQLVNQLVELDKKLKEANYTMYINQAHRTYDIQKWLYDMNSKDIDEETGKMKVPTCNPGTPETLNDGCTHLQGAAIDVVIKNEEGNRIFEEDFLCPLGWLCFKGERWHFEYGSTNWQNAQKYMQDNDVDVCSYSGGLFYA